MVPLEAVVPTQVVQVDLVVVVLLAELLDPQYYQLKEIMVELVTLDLVVILITSEEVVEEPVLLEVPDLILHMVRVVMVLKCQQHSEILPLV
jgi:hypothetical protein|tara:strand:+ start:347 stop:622 length:276 start_codon:yes stop_codon:yes gene_type:complete